MTSSISFGAPVPKSIQAQALEQIDYRNQPFANKDFVRNMQWLNESVTSLSQYTQLLQKGVDSANNNILEQIQSFAADLFLIFAGLEPTGIDLGDLTYVLQGIGSLLGINPDTPFPLNLFEAAWHLFSNFIVPLPQFTDLIFDAIIAWAMALGFSDEAVDAIQGFSDAVVDLYNDIEDIFGILGDAFKYLLKGLGLGSGSINLGPITDFWNNVTGWINDILEGPRDLLLNILNNIVIALFKSMTWFVNTVNPKHILEATGIRFIGPELAPDISDLTTVWSVGSNPNSQWVFDSTLSSGGSSGCFKTNGTGSTKRVLTQGVIPVTAGSSYHLSGQTKWTNIPSNFNSFGPCVVWLSGLNEVSQTNVNTPSGHGEDGGWTQAAQEVVAPANVDGCMIGCRVTSTLTRGTVYVDQISFTGEANLGMGLAQGILDFPKNLFNAVKASLTALYEFFFGQDSLLGKVLAGVIPALDASIIATGKFAQELVDGLGDALSNLGTAVNTALDGVGDLLYDLWNNPAEVLGNIAQSMVDGLETAFTNVGNWVTDVSNWVQDVIDAVIGALTGIPIIGGVIQNIIDGFENLFDWLFGQTTPKATLAGAAIPALDASKIDRGVFAEEIIPDLDGAKITKGTVVSQRIAELDASKITTGEFGTDLIANGAITNAKVNDIAGDKVTTGTVAAARIGELDASKIKTGVLGEDLVPELPASKITSGTLSTTLVPDLPASKITSGTLTTTVVPDLPASKITSGTLGTDQIPTLNADKIGAGTLNTSRIPDLTADKITSGTLNTSRIPSLAADKITSGTLGTDRIPSLAADKITSGTLNTGRIPNITRSMSTDLQATITNVYQGWYGTAGSGDASTVSTTIAAIKTSIGGGWTVEVLPYPSGTWTRPYATNQFLDFWAICIASGGGGGSGSANTSTPVSGGAGGLGGKYLAQQINPSSIPATVNYVIGAGGAGSPGRLNGGANIPAGGSNNTNFGTLANTASATTSAIGSLVGFYDGNSSQAGNGGNGGSNSTAATAGNATPLASGGAAGNPGGGGGTVNLSTSQSRCGGGGGGGGSYGSGSGGNGGAGGYPGGGGGGGGGRTGIGVTSGSGGAGADGAIVLLYKVAT